MSTRSEHDRHLDDWHLDDRALRAYAGGGLDFAAEASVEAHLLACAQCRGLAQPVAEPPRLETVWAEVVDEIDSPRRTLLERLLVRIGIAEHTARLLAATPSLRTSWLSAVAAALVFAVAAAHASPRGTLFFLVLAPILPVAGVAAAYGRHADPAYDVGLAAPFSSLRLLLLRTSAVLSTTGVFAAVTAAFLPAQAWVAAAWLLPALALTGATLALSTRYDASWSAVLVASVWMASVFAPIPVLGLGYTAFGAVGQLTCLAVALGSCLVLRSQSDTLSFSSGRTP